MSFVDPHTKTGGERAEFTGKAEGIHAIASSCLEVYVSSVQFALMIQLYYTANVRNLWAHYICMLLC